MMKRGATKECLIENDVISVKCQIIGLAEIRRNYKSISKKLKQSYNTPQLTTADTWALHLKVYGEIISKPLYQFLLESLS